MAKKGKSDRAFAYAYRLLNIRPRSEKELRERLSGRGFGKDAVCEVVSFLKEKNIIDDSKFARAWIESRMRAKPKGDMALRGELRQKGVSAVIVEQALSGRSSGEAVACRDLAKKRMKAFGKLPEKKARRKLFSFLAGRGFKFEAIDDVITEIFGAQ